MAGMALYTPWKVEKASDTGAPKIVNAYGATVCSFGTQTRWYGAAWSWEIARAIVEAVNREAELRASVRIES